MIAQVFPAELSSWLEAASAKGQAAGSVSVVPVVLDVREPWELQTASVMPQGFDLVAIPMNEIPARLSELEPQRPLACLCHHGARSQRVAHFLVQNGFENVVNLAGGIDAWSLQRDAAVPRY